MPKYDYTCAPCHQVFEISRSFADADKPVTCPLCGGVCQQAFAPPTFFSKGDRFEQATKAKAHWDAKGLGSDIAGHEPPAIGWSHHDHSHAPGSAQHEH